MIFFKKLILVYIAFFSPIISWAAQEDLDIAKLQACKKISVDDVQKALSYCDNPLNWSTLNYAIEMKDYKTALLVAEYTRDINQKDSAYSSNLTSQRKINACKRNVIMSPIKLN